MKLFMLDFSENDAIEIRPGVWAVHVSIYKRKVIRWPLVWVWDQ